MIKRLLRFWLAGFLMGIAITVFPQEGVTTFGIQVKPIIPNKYLDGGEVTYTQPEQEDILYRTKQLAGFSSGMVIRHGFTKSLSIESGINFTKRNFRIQVEDPAFAYNDTTYFSIIGYEIPLQGLVYVRLADKIYMNTSFGVSANFFPSDVYSAASETFYQRSYRNNWAQAALIANLGYEYRTEKSGYFYLGASWHRPFVLAYGSRIKYHRPSFIFTRDVPLRGNYLTIDFRYFFHEDPKKKEAKRKK